ncbi:MAG: BamA/TamA family outer membrane protein, partial [Daejeonella sp.]
QSSGKIFFAGVSQSIDSRNTNTYTTKGTYIKVNYSYAPDFFGGDNFNGSLLKADFRTFKSLASKLVLGVNGNYQSLNGNRSPFYLLPQLGNDNIMRGYYTGRYRDNNLLALQAEIRYRFNPRFGLVGFAGGGTVYKSRNFSFADLKPSLGGGFRYFFDVERGLSVRMDYAIGEKRAGESRQSGFYLALGESF